MPTVRFRKTVFDSSPPLPVPSVQRSAAGEPIVTEHALPRIRYDSGVSVSMTSSAKRWSVSLAIASVVAFAMFGVTRNPLFLFAAVPSVFAALIVRARSLASQRVIVVSPRRIVVGEHVVLLESLSEISADSEAILLFDSADSPPVRIDAGKFPVVSNKPHKIAAARQRKMARMAAVLSVVAKGVPSKGLELVAALNPAAAAKGTIEAKSMLSAAAAKTGSAGAQSNRTRSSESAKPIKPIKRDVGGAK